MVKPASFRLNLKKGNMGGTPVKAVDASSEGNSDIIKGYPIDSLRIADRSSVVTKIDVEGHEIEARGGI